MHLPLAVDVWRIELTADDAPLRAVLSAEERERADRFHFDADRQRYTAAHAALRQILARYVATPASDLAFWAGPHGKPALSDFPQVQFNLSHSGDLALLAVTRDVPLGIDVEQRARIVRSLPAIERHLSASERDELAGLTEPQRQAALARLWVCKEAWIKGTGEGLSRPLDSFDVSVTGDQPRLLATRPLAQQAAEWRLTAIDLGEAYVAALAVQSPSVEITIREWSPLVP